MPRSKNNELVSSAADRGIHLVSMIMMDGRRKRGDENVVLRRKIQQRRMRRRRGRRVKSASGGSGDQNRGRETKRLSRKTIT